MAEERSVEYLQLMEGFDTSLTRKPLGSGVALSETDLWNDAWSMQNGIKDQHVLAKDLFVSTAVDPLGQVVPVLEVAGKPYLFTSTAFAQLAEKSGAGVTSYLKKCITNKLTHLVSLNLNAWLAKQGDTPLMLRLHEGSVIAVLSSKYGVFDHGDALDSLADALDRFDGGTYDIEAYSLTLDNMNVRLVDTEGVVLTDGSYGRDTTTAGLIFRNGQTGRSYASIEFLLFTFACTNGLIVSQDRGMVYRRRHISIGKADFRDAVLNALEQFPGYVTAARESIDKAREVRLAPSQKDLLMTQVQRDLVLSDETVQDVFLTMENKWDSNAWGLAGAITEVAQQFSAERQYQFEKYAGELMERLAA